jgi:hypothetical protein
MPEQGKWRISTAYDYVQDLDAPDLAWEFLRRNPEYQKDFARMKSEGQDDGIVAAALAEKWGLSFRGGPRNTGARGWHCLDPCGRSVDPDTSDDAEMACAVPGECCPPSY